MNNENSLGFLSYEGDNIIGGAFDARQSANALLGLDEAIKYVVRLENPELNNVDFTLPVKIREGSWIVDVLSNIDVTSVIGTVAVGAYLKSLAEKAAQDGLFETGPVKDIKKIVAGAITTIKCFAKIRKHIKKESVLEDISANDGNIKLKVGEESISVPIVIYNMYKGLPEDYFDKITEPIDENISLVVAAKNERGEIETERIKHNDRPYFHTELVGTEESVVLFPEFTDGMGVRLDGVITRNNDKTNTIGFEYRGHILTCLPSRNRSVNSFKNQIVSASDERIFSTATIEGVIQREGDKKPRIIFDRIIPRDTIIKQGLLF